MVSNKPAVGVTGNSYIGSAEKCYARTLDFYLGQDLMLMNTFLFGLFLLGERMDAF